MNKYIILLILLLLIIIFYFTYKHDKQNIEKFESPRKFNNSVVTFLANNYLAESDNGSFAIRKRDGTNTGIVINNGILSVGNNFSFDPSNNQLKCGNYNIEKDGTIKNNVADINTDPSGNVIVNDFIYNTNKKELIKRDNSFKIDPSGNLSTPDFNYNLNTKELNNKDKTMKVDPSGNVLFGNFKYNNNSQNLLKIDNNLESNIFDTNGNINFGEYIYSTNGTVKKNDNSVTIDPNGNIDTLDYIVNLNNKDFRKKDGSIVFSNNSLKCGEYDSDSQNKNRKTFKLGQYYTYFVENDIIKNAENTFSVDGNNLNFGSATNKYNYNLASKVLTGNDNKVNKFVVSSPQNNEITLGLNGNIIYNRGGTGIIS